MESWEDKDGPGPGDWEEKSLCSSEWSDDPQCPEPDWTLWPFRESERADASSLFSFYVNKALSDVSVGAEVSSLAFQKPVEDVVAVDETFSLTVENIRRFGDFSFASETAYLAIQPTRVEVLPLLEDWNFALVKVLEDFAGAAEGFSWNLLRQLSETGLASESHKLAFLRSYLEQGVEQESLFFAVNLTKSDQALARSKISLEYSGSLSWEGATDSWEETSGAWSEQTLPGQTIVIQE